MEWQKLDKIRILMGDEVSQRTRQAFTRRPAGASPRRSIQRGGREREERFPFRRSRHCRSPAHGQIECRVYRSENSTPKPTSPTRDGSHWFRCLGRFEQLHASRPDPEHRTQHSGQSRRRLPNFRNGFEQHWNEGEDITPDIMRVIERQIARIHTVSGLCEGVQEFFKSHEQPPAAWEKGFKDVSPLLDQYQKEATTR